MYDALTAAGSSTASRSEAEGGRGKSELGQDDFLKLMITQFQNQDPFAPMENGDFIAQMAQFTSASGISDLQRSFDRFSGAMLGEAGLKAVGLVGREVLVESDVGVLPAEGSLQGRVDLPSGVEDLVVHVRDPSGSSVAELQLGSHAAGIVPFSWDGIDSRGAARDPGSYELTAEVRRDGDTQAVALLAAARVNSVSLGHEGAPPKLNLDGLGDRALSAIRQIQ